MNPTTATTIVRIDAIDEDPWHRPSPSHPQSVTRRLRCCANQPTGPVIEQRRRLPWSPCPRRRQRCPSRASSCDRSRWTATPTPQLATAGRRIAAGDSAFRTGRRGGAAPPVAAADRHRRLRRVDRTQLAAADRRGDHGAAQPHPPRTFDPGDAHRRARQRLHHAVPRRWRRPGHLPEEGRRDVRLGRRAVVLQPDPAVQQRAPGLVVVGDPVAEPGPGAHSRPRAGRLQRRRGGARPRTPSRPRTTGTSSSRSAAASCVPAVGSWC